MEFNFCEFNRARAVEHIFLSAHLDDVVLSCGGLILRLSDLGQAAIVVTIFAGRPSMERPLPPLAQSFHARWDNPEDVLATRRAEDIAAVAAVGGRALHLDFEDSIYRGTRCEEPWPYTSINQLKGQVHPADTGLAIEIAFALEKRLPKTKDVLLYAPPAIGNHIDHQITLAAAKILADRGWFASFFEDYRYVEFAGPGVAEKAASKLGCHKRKLVRLDEKEIEAKIRAIRCYESQMGLII